MAARFDDPTYYPQTAGLAARVRAVLGTNSADATVRTHTDNLAGQSSAYQTAYLAALAPAPADRADSRIGRKDSTRLDATAAAARFRADTEQAWRNPTVGMRLDVTDTLPARAPTLGQQAAGEHLDADQLSARFKLATEQAWRTPSAGTGTGTGTGKDCLR